MIELILLILFLVLTWHCLGCNERLENPYISDLNIIKYQNIYDWDSIDKYAIKNTMQLAETDRSDWLFNNAIRYKIIQNNQRANLVKTG